MKHPLSFFLILLVAGCATFNPVDEERGLASLIALIDRGDAAALAELTNVPFLFDAEILLVKQDAETLWTNAAKSGFTIEDPRVTVIEPADASYAKLFSDSMETSVFFNKYLPKRAVFARVESDSGAYLFVLGERVKGIPTITAFKGPTP